MFTFDGVNITDVRVDSSNKEKKPRLKVNKMDAKGNLNICFNQRMLVPKDEKIKAKIIRACSRSRWCRVPQVRSIEGYSLHKNEELTQPVDFRKISLQLKVILPLKCLFWFTTP